MYGTLNIFLMVVIPAHLRGAERLKRVSLHTVHGITNKEALEQAIEFRAGNPNIVGNNQEYLRYIWIPEHVDLEHEMEVKTAFPTS